MRQVPAPKPESSDKKEEAPNVLPIPLFRVLEEEFEATHDQKQLPPISWKLEETDLPENLDTLPKELIRLACGEGARPSRAALASDLTRLLDGDTITKALKKSFQGSDTWGKIDTLIRVAEDSRTPLNDRQQANRRLLEAAFPGYIGSIDSRKRADHYKNLHKLKLEEGALTALCLSGGGIRSATFGLGVLQGLAQVGAIGKFTYLSTVSGGGYIGGWLSSWIHRSGLGSVTKALDGKSDTSVEDPEPAPIRNLRAYSNYLTPRLGFLSADTWTLIGTYLRNLLLNWLVFVPLLMAVVSLPRLGVAVLHIHPEPREIRAFLGLGFLCGIGALVCIIRTKEAGCRASDPAEKTGGSSNTVGPLVPRSSAGSAGRTQLLFLVFGLLPLWLSAVFLSTFWAWIQNHHQCPWIPSWAWLELFRNRIVGFVAFGTLIPLLGWLGSGVWKHKTRQENCFELLLTVASGLASGLLLLGAATLSAEFIQFHQGEQAEKHEQRFLHELLYVCFATPLFFTTFLLGATLFVGISSRKTTDEDREGWARVGAWVLIALVAWSVSCFVALLGVRAITWSTGWVASLGGLSGLFTLIMGRSQATPGTARNGEPSLGDRLISAALSFTAPVFIALIIIGVSYLAGLLIFVLGLLAGGMLYGEDSRFVLHRLLSSPDYDNILHHTPLSLVVLFISVALGIGLVISRLMDINKFSIHALYRDRLIRAYLGASRLDRRPNPFTGFANGDNLPLGSLKPPPAPPGGGDSGAPVIRPPLHLVNMAINLTNGSNLAWQQRKAESFTASALHCGSRRLGYRQTSTYAVGKASPKGLTLGTAMAISGAAASPNMGYHSSPMLAALLTFFNIRLGWWLGNPGLAGNADYHWTGPKSGVYYWIREAFGLTNDTSPFVYLSDGGHFENLGLYEMVLRRCKIIVVSDAGCDPRCNLEDLGNAIRKIRIDQGIDIKIEEFGIFSREGLAEGKVGKYCAIGTIDYEAVDGPAGSGEPSRAGMLIYLKPAIYGVEPKDVFNYQKSNKAFPHEPTSDQWFSESQFESYRVLGFHIIERISEEMRRKGPGRTTAKDLAELLKSAEDYVSLPLSAPPSGWPAASSPLWGGYP